MSTEAIVMLTVFAGLIWGGLALCLAHLRRHPDDSRPED
ncbi:hypothetical protein DI005_17565 [Prauserella sp. PE36]|uniref:Methionine/alanine import family NSS transporter small subunit n=1 Tax=Prauserella endophytica TaxID=1592324 RepID=A0ABY2RV38_9PSEU|nr:MULTISPECIES: methionine/alanine import family NSS transporter small subunit [Prauserella]RBM18834.1 hypothetical protein DI005_17565 [Prauserella sp. PE36]TKG61819.1 methionine/alanine import family NSS transporter small subunit [Prauserella endophytica]